MEKCIQKVWANDANGFGKFLVPELHTWTNILNNCLPKFMCDCYTETLKDEGSS